VWNVVRHVDHSSDGGRLLVCDNYARRSAYFLTELEDEIQILAATELVVDDTPHFNAGILNPTV
jgi:hypothetical protein